MTKTESEVIWTWLSIANEFGVHESTVKRWCRMEPEFRSIIHLWRRRVFAYKDDLEAWREKMTFSMDEVRRDGG